MDVLLNNLDLFVLGFANTVLMFAVSAVFSLLLGVVIGVLRISPSSSMRAVGTTYVNLLRNTPLALLMMFFALGYPKLGLPALDYTTLAIIALVLYTASYVAEVFRSGINSIHVGQTEAARAIGLTFDQVITVVLVPQAFRNVVPPLISVFIALLKNTTVASGFSVMQAGAISANMSERGENLLATLLWVAFFFFLLVMGLAAVQRKFERKWAQS
ncbi:MULTISPECIES: amino acid ABC transporter permease [Microterricola]|uniref:Glutamate transport system permease protein n=2 Tax=Microterricola TaxID=518733 RepID=A0A1H1MNF3_9MICO|nr:MULTISPECIES: amino acid ABC transporter permease [Microterricola]PPL18942.1 amino acid ABC transporter permease [Microterricola pindariensis]SDR87915.1 glutamate transport system permease protein [Microterricola viridarii]